MSDTKNYSSYNVNLEEVHDTFIELAAEAGRMILASTGNISWEDKTNSVDFVTETDAAVEKYVFTELSKKFPDFEFLGEETYKPGISKLSEKPTFIVDPIDGTTNFVHSFPHSCISLGLSIDRKPVVGVIYNPFLDQLYTAIKGKGAFLNKSTKLPIPSRRNPSPLSLNSALIAIEWGSTREGNNFHVKTKTFNNLAKSDGGMVHGFRSLGSAELNLCAVASGSLDAYWEGGCYAWDVCAGWAILAETGGVVVSGNPGNFETEIDSRVYLAVRGGENQKQFIEDFWSHIDGKLEY